MSRKAAIVLKTDFSQKGAELFIARTMVESIGPIKSVDRIIIEKVPNADARFSFGYLSEINRGGTDISIVSSAAHTEYKRIICIGVVTVVNRKTVKANDNQAGTSAGPLPYRSIRIPEIKPNPAITNVEADIKTP